MLRPPFATWSRRAPRVEKLPDAAYVEFVDGLLIDAAPVFNAALSVSVIEMIAALAAGSGALAYGATAQLLVGALRLYFMHLHMKKRPIVNVEIARKHELIFAVGVIASLATLSIWTLAAFAVTDNNFTRLLGTSMTIAYTFSTLTRSFAIYRGVNVQIVAAFGPLSAAMLLAGGWYPAGIVAGLLPLSLFMRGSAERVRENFLSVIAARGRATTLATRLDLALSNMSHGLVMIDGKGLVTLVNARALGMLGLREGDMPAGATLGATLRRLARDKIVGRKEISRLWRAFDATAASGDFVAPFAAADGRAIEITAHRMSPDGAVLVVQDVTERRDAALAMDRMARLDPVTDLPNRRMFEERLAATLKPASGAPAKLNVLFLDLDDFKQVNDSLGHARGDKLLAEIAKRLCAIVRPSDLVARWGGDEFAILQGPVDDPQQAGRLAARIIREIQRPAFVDGYEVIVGASIGGASAPYDGTTPEGLLSNADMALYAAKGDGRGVWRPFEPSMDAKIQVRRLIELDLRAAVANDAIELHYQPIHRVADRGIASFEALARWTHARRGRVSPAEFIPIIEELGLMEAFGANILRRACQACAKWPDDVSVSVNLSPAQFRGGRIEQTVRDALAGAGLRPARLDLEITESTLLDDRGSTRSTLEALRGLGVRISLDDFGTGYSSLSYILAFPLDRIKIDRSFTAGLGLQDRASILVESVAQMCAKLGMGVLVEGVETEAQLRFLERVGTIAEVQGYYFNPALPEREALALLADKGRRDAA